jgi:hypothetical protein
MRRNRDGKSVECFRIFLGGHNGIDNRLAETGDVLFAEEIPAIVEKILYKMYL